MLLFVPHVFLLLHYSIFAGNSEERRDQPLSLWGLKLWPCPLVLLHRGEIARRRFDTLWKCGSAVLILQGYLYFLRYLSTHPESRTARSCGLVTLSVFSLPGRLFCHRLKGSCPWLAFLTHLLFSGSVRFR